LQDAGASVRAYDPAGMALARTLLDNVAFAEDAYRCAEGAHALVLVTEWEAFRALDLGRIRDLLVTPILVDLRNCRLRSNRDIGMETWESRHPGYVQVSGCKGRSETDLKPGKLRIACVRLSGCRSPDAGV
jgi:hypothetical protein